MKTFLFRISCKNYTKTFLTGLQFSFLNLFDCSGFLFKNIVSVIMIYLKIDIICHYFMFSSHFLFFFLVQRLTAWHSCFEKKENRPMPTSKKVRGNKLLNVRPCTTGCDRLAKMQKARTISLLAVYYAWQVM